MKLPGHLRLTRDLQGHFHYHFQAAHHGASRQFRRERAGAAQDLHELFGFPTFYAAQVLANFSHGESRQLRAVMDRAHFQMLKDQDDR